VRTWRITAAIAAIALVATACGSDDSTTDTATDTATEAGGDTAGGSDDSTTDTATDTATEAGGDTAGAEVSGTVIAAGSSTVLPVAEYVLEVYRSAQPGVDASYTSIGSGGGFERLCDTGDVDVSGASRAIRDEEAQICADNGIEFIELQFGVDALTMVTSPETDYVECLTTDQIVQIFGPDRAQTWDEVVDGAPAEAIDIYAPDVDSGTYGFMVEDVMDLEESTQDYSASADDNIIVQGIESGAGTWGYFGLAYYAANAADLKAIAHDGGDGCVLPSIETAAAGEYGLTRPLYIYVNVASLTEKPEVANFVDFFLDTAVEGINFVGYVEAPDALGASRDLVASTTG
jgi:phosphate transport system substrate-binding protein